MPSDSNGVYSLPGGYQAEIGDTIQPSQHNPPLEDLGAGHTARLMRSGAGPMTGPLKHADGTEGAPAVTFNTNVTTGFYKTTNGVGVSVGGIKVAEFTAGGISQGAFYVGQLIPFTGRTVQPLTVFPFGQTLSRVTFSKLWAFAQIEIAAGNLFYNNGNGVDTFGIGDMRGRVFAGLNNMGGVSSGRLGSGAGFSSTGGADPNIIGSAAGVEIHTLTVAQLASHSHANTLNDPGHFHDIANSRQNSTASGVSFVAPRLDGGYVPGEVQTTPKTTGITISNAGNGGDAPHNNVQPTLVGPWLLFAGQ